MIGNFMPPASPPPTQNPPPSGGLATADLGPDIDVVRRAIERVAGSLATDAPEYIAIIINAAFEAIAGIAEQQGAVQLFRAAFSEANFPSDPAPAAVPPTIPLQSRFETDEQLLARIGIDPEEWARAYAKMPHDREQVDKLHLQLTAWFGAAIRAGRASA